MHEEHAQHAAGLLSLVRFLSMKTLMYAYYALHLRERAAVLLLRGPCRHAHQCPLQEPLGMQEGVKNLEPARTAFLRVCRRLDTAQQGAPSRRGKLACSCHHRGQLSQGAQRVTSAGGVGTCEAADKRGQGMIETGTRNHNNHSSKYDATAETGQQSRNSIHNHNVQGGVG